MVANRDVRESLLGSVVAFTTSMIALGIATVVHLAAPTWSIAASAAVLASIGLGGVAARASARVAMSAAIGVLFALVPIVLLGCSWAMNQPLAMTGTRCGTGDFGLPLMLVLVGFVGSTFAFMVALLARRVARAAPAFAIAFVVAGALDASHAIGSLSKPEPDSYLRLFERTSVDAGGHVEVGGESVVYDAVPHPAALLGDRWCALHVGSQDVTVDAFDSFDTCPRLVVARDAKTSLVLVFREDRIGELTSYSTYVLFADEFRGRLGAPRAWVFGAFGGIFVALGALVMALRARRPYEADAIETNHTGNGWVTLDGVPRFVAQLATRPPGPVVIATHGATRAPTYRDDGAAKIFKVTPGNLATLRAEARVRAAAWAFVAIASVAATSAPLWVARVFGLL